MKIIAFLIGMIPVIIVIFYVVLIVAGSSLTKKYTKKQLESGEDKRIFTNFARTLFENPDAYQYVAGGYTKRVMTGSNEYTYYYHSYVVAFNEEGELWVCPYQCQNHVPVLTNMMKVDFSEASISANVKKNQTNITIRIAGEPMEVQVKDIIKSAGADETDEPFAMDQSAERQRLNQVIPKFKELRKQMKG